jgi:septal ring factor EnvC (AmiA/AmiB activator)
MICSYCSSQTDSVLALSCQHYICIPCAIKHSPRSAAPEITCEICGLKTAIAEQALGRLRLLATLGSADGESGTHDLASIQEALKKLDMEQHDCSRKIAKLTEVFNTSVVKIRQKFTVLRTQIDSKESALIALA